MSKPVRKVTAPHLWETLAVDITWDGMIERLNQANVTIADVPDEVYSDPVFRGQIILDAHLASQVITKEEARYLLIRLTDVPNDILRQMINRLDASTGS